MRVHAVSLGPVHGQRLVLRCVLLTIWVVERADTKSTVDYPSILIWLRCRILRVNNTLT